MRGYSAAVVASAEQSYEDSLAYAEEAARKLDRVRDMSGDAMWRLAEEVLGADVICDLMLERMSDWDAEQMDAAARRAAVKL